MIFDLDAKFAATEAYFKLNEKFNALLQARLPEGTKVSARIYSQESMAGYDIIFGLLSFLSHKPKAAIARQGFQLADVLMPQFLRLQTPLVIKADQQSWDDFIDALDHEVNFVVWTRFHEVTKTKLVSDDEAALIHQKISAKRIYSIEIVDHLSLDQIPHFLKSPYSIFIARGSNFDYQQNKIVAYFTEKFKAPTVVGAFQDLYELRRKFENSFDHYFSDHFVVKSKTTDVYEAVQIYEFHDLSGVAVKQELRLTDQQAFAPAGLAPWILESWGNWWPEAVQNKNDLRGLLVIKKDRILASPDHKNNFDQKVHLAAASLRQQSKWSCQMK